MNIDRDPLQADWLRVIARMRILGAMHPELSDEELRIAAESSRASVEV